MTSFLARDAWRIMKGELGWSRSAFFHRNLEPFGGAQLRVPCGGGMSTV